METKPLAWNEIFITVPPAWEIDELDETYMLIGEKQSPRLELKWTSFPGRIKPEAHLKKFVSNARRKLGIEINEQNPPSSFVPPENSFDYFFFSWKQKQNKGDGVIIFCKQCKKISLLRFFPGRSLLAGGGDALAARILATFCDHPKKETTRWALFGMNFSLPNAFCLKDYNFSPGCFTLKFKRPSDTTYLTVFSWGPASFLLSKTDLSQFALQRIKGMEGLGVAGTCTKGAYVQWQLKTPVFNGADRLLLFKRFTSFKVFRICRDEADNRILGILVASSSQFEKQLVQEFFSGTL